MLYCVHSRHSSNQHYYLLYGRNEQMEMAAANNKQTTQIDCKCVDIQEKLAAKANQQASAMSTMQGRGELGGARL